jgi:ribonucleoside-diphosphate reductase alpha chain
MWPVCEKTGESGWQACNLSTINCSKIKTEQDFFDACRAATIIGTLQAGFSEFEYLGGASERIIAREALLGVSMTGIMETQLWKLMIFVLIPQFKNEEQEL